MQAPADRRMAVGLLVLARSSPAIGATSRLGHAWPRPRRSIRKHRITWRDGKASLGSLFLHSLRAHGWPVECLHEPALLAGLEPGQPCFQSPELERLPRISSPHSRERSNSDKDTDRPDTKRNDGEENEMLGERCSQRIRQG